MSLVSVPNRTPDKHDWYGKRNSDPEIRRTNRGHVRYCPNEEIIAAANGDGTVYLLCAPTSWSVQLNPSNGSVNHTTECRRKAMVILGHPQKSTECLEPIVPEAPSMRHHKVDGVSACRQKEATDIMFRESSCHPPNEGHEWLSKN